MGNQTHRDIPYILLTIDVEDWFQVENFRRSIPFSSWSSCELRVEKNTNQILDLLDNFTSTQNSKFKIQNSIKATFFVLGWIAERLPGLVREIHSRGHEVASHGFLHKRCFSCSSEELKNDLADSKSLLEDIIGDRVWGYRAPSFSINLDMLKIVEECGYLYDSSYNSFALHGRYGQVDFSQNDRKGIAIQISKTQNPKSKILSELPVSNIKLGKCILPWGGGAYFRLIPYPLFKLGVASVLRKTGCYLFYLHPWEIDPKQPRVHGIKMLVRLRHYSNLKRTSVKLKRLIRDFRQSAFMTCRDYVALVS